MFLGERNSLKIGKMTELAEARELAGFASRHVR
jgi:hypothetical protein